jgi:hypothetical protein
LRGSEVGPRCLRGSDVVPRWRLGEVAIFLPIAMNLLKWRGVVARIATNLTNRRVALGFNIHRCTSVMKNRNTT